MVTILICGGCIEQEFAVDFINRTKADCLIAVDAGLVFCNVNNLMPHHILGDFDSVPPEVIQCYHGRREVRIHRFNAEKDYTDTQVAVELAVSEGSSLIYILGATGGRMDHFWGNVQTLAIPAQRGIRAAIVDSQNYITLLSHRAVLKRSEQFGTYVSFFSMGETVTSFCLEGFKYPLHNFLLDNTAGLTVSNEISEEEAIVSFESGTVIMMMTKDADR